MGLYCGALGLRMCDFSGNGQAFAVHPNCLPFSCEELVALNRSIIHSIRGCAEGQFRAFFRNRRSRA